MNLPGILQESDDRIPEAYRIVRDQWWERLEPLLKEENRDALLSQFGKSIADFAHDREENAKSVYRQVYRFFYGGCVRNALLPHFYLRGGPGKTRTPGTVKRGRPRKLFALGHEDVSVGVNVTEEDVVRFHWALRTIYQIGEHETLKDTYEAMCREKYVDKMADGELKLHGDRPSYQQFCYYVRRMPDLREIIRQRMGEKKFDRNCRAVTGRTSEWVHGPAERYQIDATIADVYLVSSINRNWLIGRPVIYVIIDEFSDMIVGLYVGLEGPSWEGARLALLNAFSDKSLYLQRYGLHKRYTWPCQDIPIAVYADRAELLGKKARGLVVGLGVQIDIASSYRPDWKGLVESRFGILNRKVIHFVPGAVVKRQRDRGDRDTRLDAVLTLAEFTKIIIEAVMEHNNTRDLKGRRSREMIADGVQATPIGLWTWGMRHLVGGTPHRAQEEIYAHLLPSGEASVDRDGIHFHGMRFSSKTAIDNAWFERARNHGRWKVEVRYHTELPRQIWVVDRPASLRVRPNVHVATLLDPHDRYGDSQLRHEEAWDLSEIEKADSMLAKERALNSKINFDSRTNDAVKRAKADRDASPQTESNAAKVKNIRGHRADERDLERKSQANRESEHLATRTPATPEGKARPQEKKCGVIDLTLRRCIAEVERRK